MTLLVCDSVLAELFNEMLTVCLILTPTDLSCCVALCPQARNVLLKSNASEARGVTAKIAVGCVVRLMLPSCHCTGTA